MRISATCSTDREVTIRSTEDLFQGIAAGMQHVCKTGKDVPRKQSPYFAPSIVDIQSPLEHISSSCRGAMKRACYDAMFMLSTCQKCGVQNALFLGSSFCNY